MSGFGLKKNDDGLPEVSCAVVCTEKQNHCRSNEDYENQTCYRQLLEPAFNREQLEAEDERQIANLMFAQKVKMEAKMKPMYHFVRGNFAKIPFGQHVNAYDAEKQETVMLKNCGKLFDSEKGFVFEEARLLSECPSHRNIILLKAIATDSTHVYAVLESAKKNFQTVMETMKHDRKRFHTNDVKEIMRQLLQGVEHLHSNRIVHRNLKPANMLIGSDGILKISDFGYARNMVGPRNPPVLLPNFYIPGHEQYAAAEEASFNKYCYMGDLWSVGCIFAELLVLEPLFRPGSSKFMEYQICRMIGTQCEKSWPECPHRRNLVSISEGIMRQRFLHTGLLTDFGYQLLSGLLRADPRDRLQAEQALFHPWFKELTMGVDEVDTLAVNLNDIKLENFGDDLNTKESETDFLYQIEVESLDGTECSYKHRSTQDGGPEAADLFKTSEKERAHC